MDQEGSLIDSIAPPQDSANAMPSQVLGDGSNNENDQQNELEGVEDPDEPLDEFSNPSVKTGPKTGQFLYLTRPKERFGSKPGTPEWHEAHTVKLPKLVDPPRRDENKKGMELKANCKHPLSQWLTSNPKHQRNLIDFNGVIQSESRRAIMEKRWRKEARQRKETKPRLSRWEMMQKWKEQEEREAMKTDDQKEQERKMIVAHVKVSSLDSSKHEQLQKYMNSMQNESDDILEINMAEKANWESSVEKKKWRVIGLINPDAHLSTLDHSVNLRDIQRRSSKLIEKMDAFIPHVPKSMPGSGPMAMPGIGPNSMPGYGPMSMPGMDPFAMPGMDLFAMPGMGPNSMPRMGPNSMPGMGPMSMPGIGANSMPGMGPNSMPGMGPMSMPRRDPKSMLEMGVENFDFVNYHHWIPTVFKASRTKCELLSQIPNLDPYRYKDSLYPMIAELFLHQLTSFENILGLNLRNIPLRVIVKSQAYELNDCSKKDFYLGNLHKEGLFERIAAVGLYYYQIDDGIKGGELSLSKYAEGRHMDMDSDSESDNEIGPRKWHSSKEVEIQVYEGTSIVFRNDHLDHQVSQLYGSGSRKIISFFLLKQDTSHHIDASKITVNWKAHSKHFVESSLRNLQNTNALARGNEWVVVLVQEYVVGNKEYIKNASDMYRRCRMKMKDLHNALLDEEAEKRMQRAMAGD